MVLLLFLATMLLVPAPSATAEELSTWDAIKKRGSIRIGVTNVQPWFWKDPQTGKWTGFCIFIADKIAETMGVKLEMVETTWGNAIAALLANQIDVMFMLDATPERALAVDFTFHPMIYQALCLLMREDMTVSTWSELNNPSIKIGVAMGSSMDRYITKVLPNANIQRYPSPDEVVASFQSGRSNCLTLVHAAIARYHAKIGSGKVIIPKPKQVFSSSMAVRREKDKTWRDYLTICTMRWYETGEIQKLFNQTLEELDLDPKRIPSIMKEFM